VHNVTLTYFLFTPLVATGGAAPTKLPLLCFLHGYGDRPRPEALGVFTDAEHQKRLPLFVLRPGSTISSNWASSLRPHSSSHISQISEAQHVLLALLDRLLGELPVNPRLLVLAGASMGAYATWDLLVRVPAVFAVGIPMSGGGDTKRAGRVTARVWAFHSRADRIVPVNASREIVVAVAAARNVAPNVGVAAGAGDVVGGALLNASWAAKGGHEGWTKDVAVGLRYTELQHASHYWCAAPLSDKGMAAPLFEWTLEQLRAAGFEGDRSRVA
jgi:predicted peptidase